MTKKPNMFNSRILTFTLDRIIIIVGLTLIGNMKHDINEPTRLTLILIKLAWRVPILRSSNSESWATSAWTKTTLVTSSLISAPLGLAMHCLYYMSILRNLNKRPTRENQFLCSHAKRKSQFLKEHSICSYTIGQIIIAYLANLYDQASYSRTLIEPFSNIKNWYLSHS